MNIRDWALGIAIKRYWKQIGEGKMGNTLKSAWDFLNGWKLVIGAVLKLAIAVLAVFGFTEASTRLDWLQTLLNYQSDLISGVAAADFAAAVFMVVGVFHKIVKAAQQLRSGVPVKDLLSVNETVAKMVLLFVLLASFSSAAEPAKNTFKWGAWGGTLSAISEDGSKQELLFGRIGGNATFDRFHLVGRLDMTRAQDGGQVDPFKWGTFRVLEPTVAAYYDLGGFSCGPAIVAGMTLSIEGSDGPYDPEQFLAAGGVRCGDSSGGLYAYVLGGHQGASGSGFKTMGSLQVPAEVLGLSAFKGASFVADGVPFGTGRFARVGVILKIPNPF